MKHLLFSQQYMILLQLLIKLEQNYEMFNICIKKYIINTVEFKNISNINKTYSIKNAIMKIYTFLQI